MTFSRATSRRRVLRAAGTAGLALVAGCSTVERAMRGEPAAVPPRSPPSGPADVSTQLRAAPATGGEDQTASTTWLYEDSYAGPELRAAEGDVVSVGVANELPAETTVHWHGVPVANEMDGVPALTQEPIETGETFSYRFRAAPSGTYLYHSHVGLQLDRGLLGPLVIEESDPHVDFDREFTVVFDDYLGSTPRPLSERQSGGSPMGGMMGGMFDARPSYAALTINGRSRDSPTTFEARAGERVRFRFVNATSATPMRVALAGHPLTVTHADGRPVEPVTVDAFSFASGERYDAVVETDSPGVWELRGAPLGASEPPASARFVYGTDTTATATAPGTPSRRLSYGDLHAVSRLDGIDGQPDRRYDLTLSAGDRSTWLIDGQAFPDADPLPVSEGDHVRLRLTNQSPVMHPMHLHGHFFRVGDAIKDTVMVPGHMGSVTIDFRADNPGRWLFHCHNLYHLEAGMAREIRYVE